MQPFLHYFRGPNRNYLETVKESRSLERFDLNIPARIFFRTAEGEQKILKLETRDISSRGAYFILKGERAVESSEVDVDLDLTDLLMKETGADTERMRIHVQGRVLRSEANGFAVSFSSRYRFEHSRYTEP